MDSKLTDAGNNFNEKLVELVGKHKILYDPSTEGYSNFQLQDEVWRTIANEMNEDVAACKLKWKNIRSCYSRYLRKVASPLYKVSRTYYLADNLKFLLPFRKTNFRQPLEHASSSHDENSVPHYSDDQEIRSIENEIKQDEEIVKQEFNTSNDENSEEEESNLHNKRPLYDRDTRADCEFNKKLKETEDEYEAEIHFFKSLLPEIRKMNGKQRNQLKILILDAIDKVLYNDNNHFSES